MNVSIENHSLALVVVVCGGGVVYTAFTAAVLCVEVDLRPQLRQFTITTPL